MTSALTFTVLGTPRPQGSKTRLLHQQSKALASELDSRMRFGNWTTDVSEETVSIARRLVRKLEAPRDH